MSLGVCSTASVSSAPDHRLSDGLAHPRRSCARKGQSNARPCAASTVKTDHGECRTMGSRRIHEKRTTFHVESVGAKIERSPRGLTHHGSSTVGNDHNKSTAAPSGTWVSWYPSVTVFPLHASNQRRMFLNRVQGFVSKPLSRRRAPPSLAQEARVVEFLACVHCAVFPFRTAFLAEAEGPREASVRCAKVVPRQ